MARPSDDPLYVEDEIPICDRAARCSCVEKVIGRTFPANEGADAPSGFRSFLLEYDTSGRRARGELLNDSGHVIQAWRYQEGRLAQELSYDRRGRLERRCDVIYASTGLWRQKRMYAVEGVLMYTVVADRDLQGRLLRATYVQRGEQVETIRSDAYRYDDHGRLVLVDMGAVGECVYEYDDGLLRRRSRNLAGASAFGDVLELEYDSRALPARLQHKNRGTVVLEWQFLGVRDQ